MEGMGSFQRESGGEERGRDKRRKLVIDALDQNQGRKRHAHNTVACSLYTLPRYPFPVK